MFGGKFDLRDRSFIFFCISQRLLAQCLQYFDLRCQMLMNLSHAEQQLLNVDIASMLEDELAWLCNFQPSCKRVSDISTDDILLTGESLRRNTIQGTFQFVLYSRAYYLVVSFSIIAWQFVYFGAITLMKFGDNHNNLLY